MGWFETIGEFGEAVIQAGDRVGDVFTTLGRVIDSTDRPRHRLAPGTRPLKGDIIARQSRLWWHLAIYEDDANVYHYLPVLQELEVGKVIRTSFPEFAAPVDDVFIVVFGGSTEPWVFETEYTQMPGPTRPRFIQELVPEPQSSAARFGLYPPAEIVRRARSRMGEVEYNLASGNCEHFAMWCATGVSRSLQVDRLGEFAQAVRGEYMISSMTPPNRWKLKPTRKELAASVSFEDWVAAGHRERDLDRAI
jgi:hypothetical protein